MNDYLRVARGQHGVVGRDQLLDLGLSKDQIWHLIASGKLTRVLQGVYAVAGRRVTKEQRIMAACRWAGDGVASHRTAAAL